MLRCAKTMTKGQVFDVYEYLASAGQFPASDAGGMCRLRTPDGRACAIGVFLPYDIACEFDAKRHSAVARKSVYESVKQYLPDWLDHATAVAVQAAHDGYGGDNSLVSRFQKVLGVRTIQQLLAAVHNDADAAAELAVRATTLPHQPFCGKPAGDSCTCIKLQVQEAMSAYACA